MFQLVWEVEDTRKQLDAAMKRIVQHNERNDTEYCAAFYCTSGAHISVAVATGLETLLMRKYHKQIKIEVEHRYNPTSEASIYDSQVFRSDGKNDECRMDIMRSFYSDW